MLQRLGDRPRLADGTPIPLSPAVRAGGLIFVSGQLGLDESGQVVSDNITLQTQATLSRIERILREAGTDLSRVVKASIWITNKADFAAVNAVWATVFGDHPPARSTVVSDLLIPGARIEVDVIAVAD